jgi:hypothetical protein
MEPFTLSIGDTLDLHTFQPREIGSLIPEWMDQNRRAGRHCLRLITGKGTGALRKGALALVERHPFVSKIETDANWGALVLHLRPRSEDEARVRAILTANPSFVHALEVLAAAGPPGAWLGGGFVRDRVWQHLHRRAEDPPTTDLDVAWFGAGDPAADAEHTRHLSEALALPWDVADQARFGATSAEAGVARWPETATAIGARLSGVGLELLAPHGWDDLLGLVVAPTPTTSPTLFRARCAAKRWRQRFPLLRVEPGPQTE